MESLLPEIPDKRYFTIGEVSELCQVKPYVLRYWEQEFGQLKPIKRRGNRRYYQHHEVMLIRRIRGLLYDEGFTIAGARNRLADLKLPLDGGLAQDDAAAQAEGLDERDEEAVPSGLLAPQSLARRHAAATAALAAVRQSEAAAKALSPPLPGPDGEIDYEWLRSELLSIRRLLDA